MLQKNGKELLRSDPFAVAEAMLPSLNLLTSAVAEDDSKAFDDTTVKKGLSLKIPVDETQSTSSQMNETANTSITFAETVATDIKADRALLLRSGKMVHDSSKDPIKVIQVPRTKETTVQNN